jgi:hypothetical protein
MRIDVMAVICRVGGEGKRGAEALAHALTQLGELTLFCRAALIGLVERRKGEDIDGTQAGGNERRIGSRSHTL